MTMSVLAGALGNAGATTTGSVGAGATIYGTTTTGGAGGVTATERSDCLVDSVGFIGSGGFVGSVGFVGSAGFAGSVGWLTGIGLSASRTREPERAPARAWEPAPLSGWEWRRRRGSLGGRRGSLGRRNKLPW